ncbi:hypothetical protein LJR029_006387 [Caballeronia sp. LjRoot29]|uniref:hypothetical protein n=1 Tax=Caballeronia sp. LjRoot29 TaxID=3342315 RepID=UPI003ED022F5
MTNVGSQITDGCFSIVGNFDFGRASTGSDSGNLIVYFAGKAESSVDGRDEGIKAKASMDLNSVAIYRVVDGKYRLSDGVNTVPSF